MLLDWDEVWRVVCGEAQCMHDLSRYVECVVLVAIHGICFGSEAVYVHTVASQPYEHCHDLFFE